MRRSGVLVILALASMLAACSFPDAPDVSSRTPTPTSPGQTIDVLFNPFDLADPVSDLSVTKSEAGSCWPSVADRGNSNAFRCFGRPTVLDPCFRSPVAPRNPMLCLDSPFADTAVAFKAGRVRTFRSDPDALPWHVQMADGQLCGALTGATGVLNGMRISYRCDDGSFLYGDVDKSQPMWTIHHQAKDSRTVVPAPIVSAWH